MLTFLEIVGKINRSCGTTDTSYTLANKAVDVNLALLDVLALALKNGGWNVDDLNHTDDPIITANIVSGQRGYYFTKDGSGNLILDIYKVMVKDSGGTFHEIDPIDLQSDAPSTMIDGLNSTGTPTKYDKTGNGLFLDLIPNYSSTGGLKIFISREMSYFTASDTTKFAGIDGLCHDYLYLKPSYEYARDKGLQNVERLFRDLQVATMKINERYGSRDKTINRRMVPNVENCR